MTDTVDLDICSGPGGWDVGGQPLGIKSIGVEIEPIVCQTARAAGHLRVNADMATPGLPELLTWAPIVTAIRERLGRPANTVGADLWLEKALADYAAEPSPERLKVRLLKGSPPCEGFSTSGAGKGREDADMLIRAINDLDRPSRFPAGLAYLSSHMKDHRSVLVLEPLRWALTLGPMHIALEQVPSVLPIWEAMAKVLRKYGYSVATGIVSAEMYGVPQTRARAVLLARRDGKMAKLPTPTHSRYHSRDPQHVDEGVDKWVSMAEALGWGPDRDAVRAEVAPRVNNQSGTEFDLSWPLDRPALTVAGRDIIMMPGANANRYNGSTKSRNDGIRVTVAEAGVLQSFPYDYPWQGTKTQQHQMAGDAVPPLLAYHLLKEVLS